MLTELWERAKEVAYRLLQTLITAGRSLGL